MIVRPRWFEEAGPGSHTFGSPLVLLPQCQRRPFQFLKGHDARHRSSTDRLRLGSHHPHCTRRRAVREASSADRRVALGRARDPGAAVSRSSRRRDEADRSACGCTMRSTSSWWPWQGTLCRRAYLLTRSTALGWHTYGAANCCLRCHQHCSVADELCREFLPAIAVETLPEHDVPTPAGRLF